MMSQPPYDEKLAPFYILHYTYGMDYTLEGVFTPGGGRGRGCRGMGEGWARENEAERTKLWGEKAGGVRVCVCARGAV